MRDPATNAVIATVREEAYAALKAAQERGSLDEDIQWDPVRADALQWLIFDQTMPEHVQDDILRRYEEAPPPRKSKPSYRRRDLSIVHVIRNLNEVYGLGPTRNRSAKTPRQQPTIYTEENCRRVMAELGMTPKGARHVIGVLRRARRSQKPT